MSAAPLPGLPKKILLATDLSCRCDRALDRSVALAKAWNATLVVAHVLDPDLDPSDLRRIEDLPTWRRPPERAKLAEAQIRRDMMEAYGPVAVRVLEGDPATRIEELAREEGCGLIVAGVARDQTFGRSFLGATVDRLVRRARTPVLVAKTRAKRPYERIVVATDFSDSSLHALEAALLLFPRAEIALLHAYEAPFEGMMTGTDFVAQFAKYEREAAAAFLAKSRAPEEVKRRVEVFIEHGSPEAMLRAYVEDKGADLIVVGSHGRSAMFDVFIGSTAKRILETARADVLLIREPRAIV